MNKYMLNIEDAWESFLINDYTSDNNNKKNHADKPPCSELYISTKTKISYLNQEIDLHKIFWEIPIQKYHEVKEGILKKQIKVSCLTKEEAITINEKMKKAECKNILTMDQIQLIDNPTARKIKFKDIRKINIGLSRKDLITFRVKKKEHFIIVLY